jgi:general bacterial porin, GBP family
MKSKIVAALIAAGACSVASAQASVTLYGIVDVGLQWNKQGVDRGTSTAPDWQSESYFGVDGGYQSGNRFGLRGSEALGGGWNAVFTLEGGFSIDTGTSSQGGRLFGRQAWAGLQGNIGTVALGRIATPSSTTGSFDMFAAADPFDGGWGINAIGSTFIAANSLREDNSIIYSSPNWGGFRAAAMYSFNMDGGETAPQSSNNSAFNISGSFATGPFYAVVTYDQINFSACQNQTAPLPPGVNCTASGNRAAAGDPDEKLLQIGATFDLKFLKLYGAYASQKNVSFVAGGAFSTGGVSTIPIPTGVGNYYDNQAYMFGATVPLFGGTLIGSYQYSNGDNINAGVGVNQVQAEVDYSVWGIGYSYSFSRRTNMYVGYGQRSWNGTVVDPARRGLNYSNLLDRDQFAIGMRHRF